MIVHGVGCHVYVHQNGVFGTAIYARKRAVNPKSCPKSTISKQKRSWTRWLLEIVGQNFGLPKQKAWHLTSHSRNERKRSGSLTLVSIQKRTQAFWLNCKSPDYHVKALRIPIKKLDKISTELQKQHKTWFSRTLELKQVLAPRRCR